jgi:hypothetical protein
MTFAYYMIERDRLLREFKKVYDHTGPQHGHHTVEARCASAALTAHARNFDPTLLPPIRPS